MEVAIFVIIAVIAVVLAVRSYSNFWPRVSKAEDELLSLCRNDQKRVERLIAHEQGKRQGLSRKDAIQYAIDSMRRDNR
jgi:Tfp pilus assembly protein PilE